MGTDGKRRPPRPRIGLITPAPSESEAAAIVAALQQFLADTAPAPSSAPAPSAWQRAALEEGVSTRSLGAHPRRRGPSD